MNDLTRRRALKTLFCSSAAMALNLQTRRVQAEIASGSLHFMAIGDFGTGGTDQKTVAKAMEAFITQHSLKPDALLLIGDNFYGPVKPASKVEAKAKEAKNKMADKKKIETPPEPFTVETKRWKTEIEDMYPTSAFPGPMYAVLGNHDYHDNKGGEKTQLAYAMKPGVRWKMPAKWYRLDLGGEKPLLTLICLDSNLPKVSGIVKPAAPKKDKDGKVIEEPQTTAKKRASLTAEEAKEQLQWLKAELAKPRAPFTLVMAHHPIYSNGDHGDTKELIAEWEPLLQQHQVHAYLCGHDHDLQHLEMEGRFTSHILSGGGGAKTRVLEHPERKMPYGKDVHGFTHIAVQAAGLTFSHYSVEGRLLHQFTKHTDGKVDVLATTPSAEPKKAKA
jgi:tartrate-resistant acid phosphatase type 5